ncbi:MAG: hypothetical protein LBB19_03790 [Puniceicoccales bacterium]|nr:hypothetical protein [Puniceicoccales bacterium]
MSVSSHCLMGKSIFSPFKDSHDTLQHFALKALDPVPYRIQFKGIVEWKDHTDRYVFLVDNQTALHLGLLECSMHGFRVQHYDPVQRVIWIEDCIENVTLPLAFNKNTYRPNSFCAVLQENQSGKTYIFSEKSTQQSWNTDCIVKVSKVNLVKQNLVVIEQNQNQKPYAYKLYLNDACAKGTDALDH